MHKIQANTSGTRSIEVSNTHLATLQKYSLLSNLIDSNGVVDEVVLDKLKLNVRSLLESERTARPLLRCDLPSEYESIGVEESYIPLQPI